MDVRHAALKIQKHYKKKSQCETTQNQIIEEFLLFTKQWVEHLVANARSDEEVDFLWWWFGCGLKVVVVPFGRQQEDGWLDCGFDWLRFVMRDGYFVWMHSVSY